MTSLQLKFTDVLGKPLDDHGVSVDIFSLNNSLHFQAKAPVGGAKINLTDCPSGVYRIELTATNYRMMQFFLRLDQDAANKRDPVIFPVDPDFVRDIDAPKQSGLDIVPQAQYDALTPLTKACYLNLLVKTQATTLGDGSTPFDLCSEITEFRQDRLFARTTAALFEETAASGLFQRVSAALHSANPPFEVFDSFKTKDAHGNLQLTFAKTPANEYQVDMDIDEAAGIEHAFEVIHNSVSGLTNPYDIREILCQTQDLKPLYKFVFAERGEASIVKGAGK